MQKNTTRSFLLTGVIIAVVAAYGTIEIVNNSAYGFIDIQTKKFPFPIPNPIPMNEVCGGITKITITVTINPDDTCTIYERTITITEDGHIRNFGTINIASEGILVNNSDNDGIINNGGTVQIFSGGILNNNSIIYNNIDGLIQNDGSTLNNNSNGTITNYGEFFAQGGTLTNDGTTNNYGGTIKFSYLKGSGGSVVNNNGIINNNNDGNVDGAIITIDQDSTFNNNGTLINTFTGPNHCYDAKQIITNYGIFNNLESGIVNNTYSCIFSNNGNGIFNNDGILTAASFINNYFATINNNKGLIEYINGAVDNAITNVGTTYYAITNLGTINNTSTITIIYPNILNNTDGGVINNKSMGVINNYYFIDNSDSIITNQGTINEYDGVHCNPRAEYNGNPPEINPLIHKDCNNRNSIIS